MDNKLLELQKEFKNLKTKWKLHVVQNSHTDLGYTHRQEWVYRLHWRNIEQVLDLCERNPKFKFSIETYWVVENFLKNTSEEYKIKFFKYFKNKQIEVSVNYLNTTNLMDADIVKSKLSQAKDLLKTTLKIGVFQDVNGIDRDYAQSLCDGGVEFVLGSIHTHHGMWAGKGKQRPFVWELNNNKKMLVWVGEHYMLGNEFGFHGKKPNKYTFKDQMETFESSDYYYGIHRLLNYLKQLEAEGYEFDSVIIPVSGEVIDNGPASIKVLETIQKISKDFSDCFSIELTTVESFYEAIKKEVKEKNISLNVEKGDWSDWWTDGIASTAESVRQYKEAQRIYHIAFEYNKQKKTLNESKIQELENLLAIFAEHTWGHYSSVTNPFHNENNLLLQRKKAMAANASTVAWELLDEIREQMGFNFIQHSNTNSWKIFNPFKEEIQSTVPLQISDVKIYNDSIVDHYVKFVETYEIVDAKGNVIPSALSTRMGGVENLNASFQNVFLVNLKLKPLEIKQLFWRYKNSDDISWTSSFKKIGVENEPDVIDEHFDSSYLRNGVENKFYKIMWDHNHGIYSIYDKVTKKELVKNGFAFRPVYDVTSFAATMVIDNSLYSSRRKMGRNRKGPNFKTDFGELINVSVEERNDSQIVKMEYKINGCKFFEVMLRLVSFNQELSVKVRYQKEITTEVENIYVELPFNKSGKIEIFKQSSSYMAWKDQISNSNIDYVSLNRGVLFDGDVAITSPDFALLQLGPINFELRKLMSKSINPVDAKPYFWVQSNYWETNFAGSLEGNYEFAWKFFSGASSRDSLENADKQLISFEVFE